MNPTNFYKISSPYGEICKNILSQDFITNLFCLNSYHPNYHHIVELIFLCVTDLGLYIIKEQETQHLGIKEDALYYLFNPKYNLKIKNETNFFLY